MCGGECGPLFEYLLPNLRLGKRENSLTQAFLTDPSSPAGLRVLQAWHLLPLYSALNLHFSLSQSKSVDHLSSDDTRHVILVSTLYLLHLMLDTKIFQMEKPFIFLTSGRRIGIG